MTIYIVKHRELLQLGLEPFHAVAVMGCNSVESFSATIGTVYAGYEHKYISPLSVSNTNPCCSGVSVGIYTTGSADICQYFLSNSKTDVVMVDNQEDSINKLAKVHIY